MLNRITRAVSRRLLGWPVLLVVVGCGDGPTNTAEKQNPPRRPTLVIVSGDHQTGEVGTGLERPLVVVLRDTLGAPVPSVLVRFRSSGGDGSDSTVTDAKGRAEVTWTLGRRAQTEQIVAQVTVYFSAPYGTVEASFVATAVAGPMARVQLTADNDVGLPGNSLDPVSVRVTDRFDNGVAGAPVAWSVEVGGGSARPLADRTDLQGVALAIWTLGPNVGENVLAVTSGGISERWTATAVTGFAASMVVVGGTHSCALTELGAAYCWGANNQGQLGIGQVDMGFRTAPVRVAGGLTFRSLAAGGFHTCGLTALGEAFCWGSNASGQLGVVDGIVATPTRVAGGHRFEALAAGSHHTCGLTTGGAIVCWGDNTAGQLGDGSDRSIAEAYGAPHRMTPAPIAGGRTFKALVASSYATCAIATTNDTYCWGSNAAHELGAASPGACRMLADQYYSREDWDWPCSTQPIRISTQTMPTSLTASVISTCGVTSAREILCWGSSLLLPQVIGVGRASAAWALGDSVCGLDADNTVSCWDFRRLPPRPVRPFGDGVSLVNLTGTASSFCGLSQDQIPIIYCWGSNDLGQLGDGTTAYRTLPVPVRPPRSRR